MTMIDVAKVMIPLVPVGMILMLMHIRTMSIKYGAVIGPSFARLLGKKPLMRETMDRKSLFALGNGRRTCTTTRELQNSFIELMRHLHEKSWFKHHDLRILGRLYRRELEALLQEELRRDREEARRQEARRRQHRENVKKAAASAWRTVLGIGANESDITIIKKCYRKLSMKHHPDRGGSVEKMAELNRAMDSARKELGFT